MPSLGEYLGALLAEVTKARVQADLESARIAQLYASHPLLLHIPVPRFRLPTITLDLPLAIDNVASPQAAGPTPAEIGALRKVIQAQIEQQLREAKIQSSGATRKLMGSSLDAVFSRLTATPLSAFDLARASGDAAAAVVTALQAGNDRERIADMAALSHALRSAFEPEFAKLQSPSPPIEVIVVTSQLREVAPPQALTRIHLTISEEGVEWTQTKPDDPSSKTLLPE